MGLKTSIAATVAGSVVLEDSVQKITSRRNMIKAAAVSGVAAGLGLGLRPRASSPQGEAQDQDAHQGHHQSLSGPLATTVVTFGSLPADPAAPLDRSPNRSPGNRNVHQLLPNDVTIKAGGTVNFIIGGFHWVAIYDDGHEPQDILVNPAVLFIDDPNRRIYRGQDPTTLFFLTSAQPNPAPPLAPIVIPGILASPGPPATAASPPLYALGQRDRVETVQFPSAGRYLVI